MRFKLLDRRRRAYQTVFNSPAGQLVLADLAAFCRANKPTFEVDDPNGRVSAYREGRREVWLRVQQNLQLSDDQMMKLITNNEE